MSAAEQRRVLVALNRATGADLRSVWTSLDLSDALGTRDALMDVLPNVGEVYGEAAGSLAADWYEDLREQAGARGVFAPEVAPMPGTARYEALVRWGITPLFGSEPDQAAALLRLAGGMQRIVSNAHRQTIATASYQDRAAKGWQREGLGGCEFCRMLIGRGAVYSEASADFQSHDHCNCVAAPAF